MELLPQDGLGLCLVLPQMAREKVETDLLMFLLSRTGFSRWAGFARASYLHRHLERRELVESVADTLIVRIGLGFGNGFVSVTDELSGFVVDFGGKFVEDDRLIYSSVHHLQQCKDLWTGSRTMSPYLRKCGMYTWIYSREPDIEFRSC